MNINIKSSRGNYKVVEFNFSKFLYNKTNNKFFYVIASNVYKKNKHVKKIKNRRFKPAISQENPLVARHVMDLQRPYWFCCWACSNP